MPTAMVLGGFAVELEIELFLALAEELHFGRAARRLGISAARASQTITRLEQRVGYQLFERTTRRVELTAAGAALATRVRPAWRHLMEALTGTAVGGTIVISFMGPVAAGLLGEIGEGFRTKYPNCDIQLRDLRINEIGPSLRSRAIDIALAPLPFDDEGFVVGPVLMSEPRALVVPAAHPLAGRDSVTLEDLAEGPLLRSSDDLPESLRLDRSPLTTPSGRAIPQGPVANTIQEAFLTVAAGRGIALVSAQTGRFRGRSDIAFLPIVDSPPFDWGLVWMADTADKRPALFAEYAVEFLRLSDAEDDPE